MFLYPAFLYFLEREYFRSYRAGSQFSVIVFEMRCLVAKNGELTRQVLPGPALADAASRMERLKRRQDLVAHYDVFDYAFLLPCGGAKTFADRLVKCLTGSPLAGIESKQLALAAGCASIPGDFTDLASLLGAADACKKRARETSRWSLATRICSGWWFGQVFIEFVRIEVSICCTGSNGACPKEGDLR